jgi:hypothetical protein
MWNKTKIDHEQLRKEIQNMSCHSKLHKLLKEELTKLDHWKAKARWHPPHGGTIRFERRK